MISFADCGNMQQTLLMLLMFVVSLLQLFFVIEDLAERRYIWVFTDGFLLLGELFYFGMLLAINRGNGDTGLFTLHPMFLWIVELVLLVYAALGYVCTLGKIKHSLSRESIKEGGDNLPDGICFFDEHGTVRLINRKMLSIGIMLFGNEIQTIDELHTALKNPPDAVECLDEAILLYRFPDGTVRRFTEHIIKDRDEKLLTEVIATDVTELYAKQAELNRENIKLADANRKMKWILDNMVDIVREEEILSMKMRIHDDIGYSILSARKALLQQQDIALIRENAVLWERALDPLYRANNMPTLPDEWETVKTRARELGLEIEVFGEPPANKLLQHLLVIAIRECVTNCVRHADSSKVFVALTSDGEEATCIITNNGRVPEQKIAEGGGLSSLRRRIEREGGRMELQSSPCFALTVILPLKEEA